MEGLAIEKLPGHWGLETGMLETTGDIGNPGVSGNFNVRIILFEESVRDNKRSKHDRDHRHELN